MSAVFAEGFEKGYLSGEQHALAGSLLAHAMDHLETPLQEHLSLRRLAATPAWIRAVAGALRFVGRLVPPAKRLGEGVRHSFF